MKIVTKKDIEKRIKEKWPEHPFEIIEYTKMTKLFTIKCLRCNETKSFSSASNFLGSKRKDICSCYNLENHLTQHKNNQQKIKQIISKNNNMEFIKFEKDEKNKKYKVFVKCLKCGNIFTKTWQSFLLNNECYYCENKMKMDSKGFQLSLPEEYTLLSDYKNTETPVLIKHDCGFIWKIRPHQLRTYVGGCPKCNKARSKGERRVGKYLDDNNIRYEMEKSFDWMTNSKRRYDFYLPNENSVIEFMGEQHYREPRVPLFDTTVEEQQSIDLEKKQDALNNGLRYLAISYKDYSKIEKIISGFLSSTTTCVDSSESKQQTAYQVEQVEDIVSTSSESQSSS